MVRTCQFEFMQPTGERGRPSAKVRHGRLELSLDVPAHTTLLVWAAAHKPLSGHVTFYETDERTARETISFSAGHCVGYHETFRAGNTDQGAYVCQLVIATEQLTLKAGGADRQLLPAPIKDYHTAMAAVAIGGVGALDDAAKAAKKATEKAQKKVELLTRFKAKESKQPLRFKQANEHQESKVLKIRGDSEIKQSEYNAETKGKTTQERKRFKIDKNQNVAYTEGVIDGKTYDVVAHSGHLDNREGTIPYTPTEKQKLKTFPTKRDYENAAIAVSRTVYPT